MATYEVDVEGATYDVDAPDEATAWKWANDVHRNQNLKPLQKNKETPVKRTKLERRAAEPPPSPLEQEGKSIGKGLALGAIGMGTLPGTVANFLAQQAGIPPQYLPETFSSVTSALGIEPAQPSVMETGRDVGNRYLERASQFALGPSPKVGALSGVLSEAGGEAFGTPGALIGAMAPTMLGQASSMAVRGAMRGASPAPMQQNLRTLGQAGIHEPTAGVASQRFGAQGVESTVSRIPGGAGIIQGKGKEFSTGMGNRLETIAAGLSPAREKFQAGRSIQTGIEDFADNLKARWAQLNTPVDNALGSANLPVSNFSRVLQQSGAPIQGAEELSVILRAREPTLVAANEALQASNGVLPYNAIRQLRTALGEKLANPQLIDDISRRTYKRLYGALTDDIRAAAGPAGVLKDFDNSNKVFSTGVDRIEGLLKQIGNKSTWEEAYNAAVSGTKDGPSKIWALRRSIGDRNFNDFLAVTIRGMGKERAAVGTAVEAGFSPETFLTNYRNLDVKTRNAMFGETTPLRQNMDTVAEAAGMLRESGKVFANPSGTAGASGAIAVGASIPTAFAFMLGGNPGVGLSLLGGALGTSLAAYGGAKLMTNPRFVKWLAESTKIPGKELPAHLGRLNAIASMEKDQEDKDAMKDFATQLSGPRRAYTQEQ